MPIYIRSSASVVGEKEGKGPLGELFDMVGDDELFGCNKTMGISIKKTAAIFIFIWCCRYSDFFVSYNRQ